MLRELTPKFLKSNLHWESAVQERYKFLGFLCVSISSLQGIAERPLPCNYNVLEFVCALSRQVTRVQIPSGTPTKQKSYWNRTFSPRVRKASIRKDHSSEARSPAVFLFGR